MDKKNLWTSEKQRIKLEIIVNFLKKKHFCRVENNNNFLQNSFWSFEGVQYFWVELWIFFSKLLSATNQQLFCVKESDVGQGPQTILHSSMN